MLMTLNSTVTKKKKKGFTLIELIIVIAIIAILAAIAIPKFGAVKKDANVKADISNAKTIQNAVATLVAKDTIVLPTSDTPKTLSLEGSGDDEAALKNYLQSSPAPKAISGSHFKVTIDKNGTVVVFVTTTKDSKDSDVEIYPTPDSTSDYAK